MGATSVQRTDHDKHGLLRTYYPRKVTNLSKFINQLEREAYREGAEEVIERGNKIIIYGNKLKTIYTIIENSSPSPALSPKIL